jgi:apolipoprotein N-acyltransferase
MLAAGIARIAHTVILAWGWKRRGFALLSGALAALSMPPFGLLPLLVVSLCSAVWLIDSSAQGHRFPRLGTLLTAFRAGWWWGFGFFVTGLWWLGSAFLVEADQFAWLMPLGVIALPAVLALFPAVAFALARVFWSSGVGRIFSFAASLTALEFARGNLFTGFPWNTLGMAFGQHLWLMQGAAAVGLYGLTLITVLLCAMPATLIHNKNDTLRVRPTLWASVVFLGIMAIGALRVPPTAMAEVPAVRLRLVQPNVPQDDKFSPENRDKILEKYIKLSDRATSPTASGVADVTHLFWPESAFPFLLHKDAAALGQIADLLPETATLITGAARQEEALPGERMKRYFNSIHVIQHDGVITGTYDKIHRVPFGEYLPDPVEGLLRLLKMRQFVNVPGGFQPGRLRQPLSAGLIPAIAMSICYEAIFPSEVLSGGARPTVLVNVTNDAWFGKTPGPHQHFAQARLRAVEEGLPMVRVANSGISGIIDPYGRVTQRLGLGVEGVVDGGLPIALTPAPLYTQWRDKIFYGMLGFVFLIGGITRLRRR